MQEWEETRPLTANVNLGQIRFSSLSTVNTDVSHSLCYPNSNQAENLHRTFVWMVAHNQTPPGYVRKPFSPCY